MALEMLLRKGLAVYLKHCPNAYEFGWDFGAQNFLERPPTSVNSRICATMLRTKLKLEDSLVVNFGLLLIAKFLREFGTKVDL
jgi:hypothetical protein